MEKVAIGNERGYKALERNLIADALHRGGFSEKLCKHLAQDSKYH